VVSLGNFSVATDRSICLEVDSASKNEYQGFLLGQRRPMRKADDLVVLKVKKIRCPNLPGAPWATSACCGIPYNSTYRIAYSYTNTQVTYK